MWQTDADTKIAVVDGELLVGYTGVLPTPEVGTGFAFWLEELLAELTSGEVVPYLQAKLTDLWRETDALREERFMLVTIGFRSSPLGATLPPRIELVSNSMRSNGKFSRYVPLSPEFSVHRLDLLEDQIMVVTQGWEVDSQEIQEQMKGFDSKDGHFHYEDLSDRVTSLYEEVASQSNGDVGAPALLVLMNKSAHRSPDIVTKAGDQVLRTGGGRARPGEQPRQAFDSKKDIAAEFLNPNDPGGILYTPASIATRRPGIGGWATTFGGRIRVGGDIDPDQPLPPRLPITPNDPGVPHVPPKPYD